MKAWPLSWDDLPLLPVAILGALALVTGIVPQLLLAWGVKLAAGTLVQAGALDRAITATGVGYTTGTGAWLPSIVWLAALVLVVLLVLLLPGEARIVKPLLHSDETLLDATVDVDADADADADGEAQPEELRGLSEPVEVWSDLTPALTSEWLMPGAHALLAGTEDEEPQAVDAADTDAEDDEDAELEVEEITVRIPGSRKAGNNGRTKGRGTAGDDA